MLRNIGVIDAAREVILNSPLIPAWEAKFRKDAMDRTVHHGTHIEGNPLNEEEVKDVLDGKEVFAKDRDIQEVINYRNVLKFIDEIGLRQHLAQTRANGLSAMIKQMKLYALGFQSKTVND